MNFLKTFFVTLILTFSPLSLASDISVSVDTKHGSIHYDRYDDRERIRYDYYEGGFYRDRHPGYDYRYDYRNRRYDRPRYHPRPYYYDRYGRRVYERAHYSRQRVCVGWNPHGRFYYEYYC